MGVKRKLRKLLAGSVQHTKSIGNKTRKTIQSVLHFPSGNGKSKLNEKLKCLGNFENSSKLELLSNEFENDLLATAAADPDDYDFDYDDYSCPGNQTHLVHVHANNVNHFPSPTSSSILFEESPISQVPKIPWLERPWRETVVETLESDSFESQSRSAGFDDQSRNVNSKHKGNDNGNSTCQSQRTEESIQVISVEQLPVSTSTSSALAVPVPVNVKSKRKRRLSLKGLKKSVKGGGKFLFSGFKAMGNSMIYATHAIPASYEYPSSYVNRPGGAVDWADEYEYEEDRQKYISFWAQALEKQKEQLRQEKEQESYGYHRGVDTCRQFQL